MNQAGKAILALAMLVSLLMLTAQPAQAAPAWWNSDWSMRAQLNVATTDALTSGYSLSVIVPHAALVSSGNSLANGNDIRIARWNGSAWAELDRILDSASTWNTSSTQIWFRTSTAVSASTSDTSYWLYYGNSAASSPPADGNNIFDLYDDFSSGSLDNVKWSSVADTGMTATVSGGELVTSGTSQVSSAYTPTGIYSNVNFTGDFAVESRFRIVTQSATAQEEWKANFGLDSEYLMVNSQASPSKRTQYYSSGWFDVGPSTLNATTFGYQRISQSLTAGGTARHWENGVLQTTRTGISPSSLGATFFYSPDVGSGGETFDARFDDVAVRKFVANEPTVTFSGPEGAEGQVQLQIEIDPWLTFGILGRNGNCNGLTNTIGAAATATEVPLGAVIPGARSTGAQDLSLATNAQDGAVVKLRSNSATSPVMSGSNPTFHIADASPGPLPSLGTEAFGFTTDDVGVAMTSGDVAAVPNNSGGANVIASATPVDRTSCVAYFVSVASTTKANSYSATIILTAIPSY